jgi:hypothetical protein
MSERGTSERTMGTATSERRRSSEMSAIGHSTKEKDR